MKSMVDQVVDVLDEACWDGYTKVGMKKKGGKMVPNCVPDSKGKIPKERKEAVWDKPMPEKEREGKLSPAQKAKAKARAAKAGRKYPNMVDNMWASNEEVEVDEAESRGKDGKGHFRSTESGAGMTAKGVAAYRKKNPGSKLQTAVTGKVKAGSKDAGRRKSFCARMSGMKGPMKDEKGRPTRKAMSLRRWKC